MELLLGAVIAVLSFLLGAVLRPYLTGYATKKGENLATHEDIDKVLEQVKAVTEATKKIEADISTGVWDRQKRWEMKREVLFEAARRLSEIDDAMFSNSVVWKEDRADTKRVGDNTPINGRPISVERHETRTNHGWSESLIRFRCEYRPRAHHMQ